MSKSIKEKLGMKRKLNVENTINIGGYEHQKIKHEAQT